MTKTSHRPRCPHCGQLVAISAGPSPITICVRCQGISCVEIDGSLGLVAPPVLERLAADPEFQEARRVAVILGRKFAGAHRLN